MRPLDKKYVNVQSVDLLSRPGRAPYWTRALRYYLHVHLLVLAVFLDGRLDSTTSPG
jgi:hypothetical protein